VNPLQIKKDERGCVFEIHLRPRSSKNEVSGIREGRLEVKVTAPPVNGQANKKCCLLLSEFLGLSRGSVEVIKGTRSRFKWVRIATVSFDVLERKVAQALAQEGES
jgi:uncharacterized protein (TIGR00251 family)